MEVVNMLKIEYFFFSRIGVSAAAYSSKLASCANIEFMTQLLFFLLM